MEGKRCNIISFINPHLFFITFNDTQMLQKQQNISKLLATLKKEDILFPSENETYFLKHSDGLYKRAKLLQYQHTAFSCWLVDYGVLYATDKLYYLPATLSETNFLTIKAGLNNIVCNNTILNETSGAIEERISNTFTSSVNNIIYNHIKCSNTVSFCEEQVIDDCHFGQLLLAKSNGTIFNLIEKLLEEKIILVNIEYFISIIKKKSKSKSPINTKYLKELGDLPESVNHIRCAIAENPENKVSYVTNWLNNTVEKKEDSTSETTEEINSNQKISRLQRSKCESSNISTDSCVADRKSCISDAKSNSSSDCISGRRNSNVSATSAKLNDSQRTVSSCSSVSSPKFFKDFYPAGMTLPVKRKDFINRQENTTSTDVSTDSKNAVTCIKDITASNKSDVKSVTSHCDSEISSKVGAMFDGEISSKVGAMFDGEIPTFSQNNPSRAQLKVGCKCSTCLLWNVSNFDITQENFDKRPEKVLSKPGALLKVSGENKLNTNIKSIADVTNNFSNIEKLLLPKFVVHGSFVSIPQKDLSNIPFATCVHEGLKQLGYKTAKNIQSYCWPAIMRNMNICMVDSTKTGKTITYIPAICSFLLDSENRYDALPKLNGPIIIVLCPELHQTESCYNIMVVLMNSIKSKIRLNLVQAVPPLNRKITNQFNKPCDVLFATPATLLALLQHNIFDLKRLCHLVFENLDVTLIKFGSEFKALLSVVQEMLEHRTCRNNVQFICTAERWTHPLEELMASLESVPFICIGNHLESALYGRADIQIVDVEKNRKLSTLYNILQDKYKIYKSVVICQEEEVSTIKSYLQGNSISHLSADQNVGGEEIYLLYQTWLNTKSGENVVFIFTDQVLLHYLDDLRTASLLINYSLPRTWTQFKRRLGSLINNYSCPLAANPDQYNCKIFTFINDSTSEAFPRIVDYFSYYKEKLPKKILKLCAQVQEENEKRKVASCLKFCKDLKLYGSCKNKFCRRRHTLSVKLDVNLNLPQAGVLKYHVINMKEINQYCIKLLEYTTNDGKDHKIHDYSDEIENLLKKCNTMEFANKIYQNDWYILEDKNKYYRCIVREIVEVNKITNQATKVIVWALDDGFTKKVSVDSLFKIRDRLKQIPPVCVELFIANIVPPFNDVQWSQKAKAILSETLEHSNYFDTDIYGIGNIVLQVNNAIWLDNLVLQRYLQYVHEYVNEFNLRKYLQGLSLIETSAQPLNNLYKICNDNGIGLPNYTMKKLDCTESKLPQVEMQWAHLTEDDYELVYMTSIVNPCNFCVQLKKFYTLFTNHQILIQQAIKEPFYRQLKPSQIIEGKCYLVKDPEGDDYCRALVTKTDGDLVHCYFVDYGDSAIVHKTEIKYLRDDLIKKLPFQAISCSLYGVKSPDTKWSEEATSVLYSYNFEPGTDCFRTLQVKLQKKMEGEFKNSSLYHVVLIDCLTANPLAINNAVIGSGFAIPVENEIIDITDFVSKIDDAYGSDNDNSNIEINFLEEIGGFEDEYIEGVGESNDVNDEFDSELYDFQLSNKDDFFRMFMGVNKNKSLLPEIKFASANRELQPITAVPASDHYIPEILWHQTENEVKLCINLTDCDKYSLVLIAGRMLNFDTIIKDKNYVLKLQLFDVVNKTCVHSATGQCVKITLTKIKKIEWQRLVLTKTVMRHIKYDIDKIVVPDEDEKRKFLYIGPDDESERIDDGYIDEISDGDDSESDLDSSDLE